MALGDRIDDAETAINTEKTEREAADVALGGRIDDAETAINTEKTEREAADALLSGRIDDAEAAINTEKTEREAADVALGNRIDDAETAINTEKTEREAADVALGNRIDDAETAINTEKTEREAADVVLGGRIDDAETAINTEKTEREAADVALGGRIDDAETAINTEKTEREAADVALGGRIDDAETAINTEKTEREAADVALGGRIDDAETAINTEKTEREAADVALGNRIDDAETAINTEKTEREAADVALGGRIDDAETAINTEKTEREAADNTEKTAREAADVVLGGRIDTEISDRQAADNAEKTAREAADVVLGSRIDTEANTREAADNALDVRVTDLENASGGQTQDITALKNALGGQFDAQTDEWSADLEIATGEGAVNYGNYTVKKVEVALEKIMSNVGSAADLGDEFNDVSATNTVNKNIAAINSKLGDFESLDDSTNFTNGRTTDEGYNVPENVVGVLNNIDKTLGTVHGLTDKLRAVNKYNGNLSDQGTVETHLVAVDTAIGDRSQMNNTTFNGYGNIANKSAAEAITSVASSIGTTADLGDAFNGVSASNTVNKNISSLNSAIGDISTLRQTIYTSDAENITDAIVALDSNMYRLDSEINNLNYRYNKLHREFRTGMASLAAMSAMAPNARAKGDTQLTLGTGAYAGNTAAAIGMYHWINNNLMVNMGVAWGNSSDAVYRMGLTFAW